MISHPIEILYGGGAGLACGANGEIHAEELQGLFVGDTRVLSTYRYTIAGHAWRGLARSRLGPSTVQWDLQNPPIEIPGQEVAEGVLHCRLRRQVFGTLHDCLVITSFAPRALALRFSLQVDADFMDVFQVKDRSLPTRLRVQRIAGPSSLSFVYERKDFQRGLHVSFRAPQGSPPTFVGTQAVFDVVIEPQQSWSLCLEAVPELDGRRLPEQGNPHDLDTISANPNQVAVVTEHTLAAAFDRGCSDLERLSMRLRNNSRFVAAGAPWFLALFGRDTLLTSLMAGLLGQWSVEGALENLSTTQARSRDDDRDAEPGKIAHELRIGELAHFHAVPHTPYYGSHDAPALFVLALWSAVRWTGNRNLLARHLPAARAALTWCRELGDEDGDGLLEYRSRSSKGYRNQGWKDSHDAIVHHDGTLAELPVATVELQGYWYAACHAMAELLDLNGEQDQALQFRDEAANLKRQVEDRFWMDDLGCYALALDGKKRPVRSIASNQGHLLWCGLASQERAVLVARRLLAADMFSGYGLRTLSAEHCQYNPLSYQLGSVWPHDSALFAAGLARYGLHEQAARVLEGIFDAAGKFEEQRLPELFCGFQRDCAGPIPYEKANVPQAWSAAVPLLATQVFLGLLPDAVNHRCYIAPWLPQWLPELAVQGIELGDSRLDVKISHRDSGTHLDYVKHAPGLEVAAGMPPAPLWGAPIGA